MQKARRLKSKKASQPLLDKRKQIVRDVEQSVEQLGLLLAEIGAMGTTTDTSELDNLTLRIKRSIEAEQQGLEEVQKLQGVAE